MNHTTIKIVMSKSAAVIMSLLILGMFSYVAFANVNDNLPWHPLNQISKSRTDLTSVDENNDGIIDHTNAGLQEITNNVLSLQKV